MMSGFVEVFLPLMVHFIISNGVILVAGGMDATAQTALTAVLVFPFLWYFYRRDQKSSQKEQPKIPWWVYPLAIVTGIVANQLLSHLLLLLQVTETFSNAAQEGLLSGSLWMQFIGLGVLVPVMEELLFRGLIYQRLKRIFPFWMAALAGAAVFAFYHGNMVQILFAFPMGLLLIFFYEKWEHLSVPIVMHMAVNISTVLFF